MTLPAQGLFHYPGFVNSTCPTYAEATDRFIYGAWNVYRVDAGNPHFGSVSFVFTVAEGLQNALIAPVDTGTASPTTDH